MRSAVGASSMDFYIAGGTLRADAPSYIERKADQELYEGLVQGQFCYVLTARQMGKSSLMVRTVGRLRRAGVAVAVLDLTAIGQNLTIDQWYRGLLLQLGHQLDLENQIMDVWQSQERIGLLQSWLNTIRQVVVPRFPERVVIFIDEIDMVMNLPFSVDEFFAGIRECYNERSQNKEMERLTFCLLGVAAPTDLVRETRMTPFNIGHRIELHDFTEDEAMFLAGGLSLEGRTGTVLLKKILYWTGGHPYLTQRFCLAVAEDTGIRSSDNVNCACVKLFLSPDSYDDNLLFVRAHMLRGTDLAALLDVYRRVRSGAKVDDDHADPIINLLRLSGVTRSVNGRLKVRNRIYARVFDPKWITSSMPDAELRRQRAAYRRGILRATLTVTSAIALLLGFALLVFLQRKRAEGAETNRRLSYDAEIRLAQEELDKANIERVNELLQEVVPGSNESDLRGFEWYQFWRDTHREIWRAKTEHPVIAVAFSLSGKSLMVAESPWTTKAGESRYLLTDYNVVSGKHTAFLSLPADISFHQIALSPDHQHVVVPDPYHPGPDNKAMASLWNLHSGRRIAHFGPHDQELCYLVFSSDGKRLATADMGGTIKIWETDNGREQLTVNNGSRRVTGVAFSADNRVLGVADNSQVVRFWNTETGAQMWSLKSDEGIFTAVAFFPDGRRLLTATNEGTLQIWDAQTRQRVEIMTGHSGYVTTITFSPDGTLLATGSYDRTVRVWSTATGNELKVFRGHGAAVFSVGWSPDQKYLISGGSDTNIKTWDIAAKQRPELPVKVVEYLASSFSSGNELLALGITSDSKATLLNISAGRQVAMLQNPAGDLLCAVFSPDKRLLATGGTGGSIQLWSVATGVLERSLNGNNSNIYGLSFSPDGRMLVSGGKEGTLILWDVMTGAEINRLSSGVENSWRSAFSPDGRYLVWAADGGAVLVWDVSSQHVVHTLKAHSETVRAIAFSPDGKWLVTAGDDSKVLLWDVVTGRQERKLGLADHVQRALFAPDGKRLVTGGVDGTVKLWDMNTNQELLVLKGHTDEVSSITFSADGRALATTGLEGTVRLWLAATDAEINAASVASELVPVNSERP